MMKEGLKLVRVCDVDTTQERFCSSSVGDFVVVPQHFPEEVLVMTTRNGHFAHAEGWRGGEEFQVFPQPTPEEAWEVWEENNR